MIAKIDKIEQTQEQGTKHDGLKQTRQPVATKSYKERFFFKLNSAEQENFSANKYENSNNICHFHIY